MPPWVSVQNRHHLDLEEEARVEQPGHDHARARGRLAREDAPLDRGVRREVARVAQVAGEQHHVVEARARLGQQPLDVAEDLFDLRRGVALAHQRARLVERDLAGEHDVPALADRLRHPRVRLDRVAWHAPPNTPNYAFWGLAVSTPTVSPAASTRTRAPSPASPPISARARRVSTSRWMKRRSGRAPYTGSKPSRAISARPAGVSSSSSLRSARRRRRSATSSSTIFSIS